MENQNMEEMNQTAKAEIEKTNIKNNSKPKLKRDSKTFTSRAKEILLEANKKTIGRKIKKHELLNFALSILKPEHIKMLQEQSLTNEDRMEQLRQKYIKIHGPISKRDFLGFTMTVEYLGFLKQHHFEVKNETVA